MDKKTIFVKTVKGDAEVEGQSDYLFGDNKRILMLVDDESTVGEITKRAPPSLRESLQEVLQELQDTGYIKDIRAPATSPEQSTLKVTAPAFKMSSPKAVLPAAAPPAPVRKTESSNVQTSGGDLDFSFITATPAKPQAAAQPKPDDTRAAQEAALKEAAAQAAKLKAYEEAKIKAQIEVAARARIEAEARAKKDADEAKRKAEQEVLRARAESEGVKARIEAEIRARLEAEAKIKREADAMRLKAEMEAERLRKELEAARLKAEMELRVRLEAEAKAKAEHEARLKREAEAERLRLEKERAELEVARIKAEAELKMTADAEQRIRAELEARTRSEPASPGQIYPDKSESDPGEKLRQSFVESFAKNKKRGDATGSFKLETFSLVDTGKIAAFAVEPQKTEVLPGAGSKVKAAIAERARKEEEAKRLKAEQEEARLSASREQTGLIKQQQEQASRLKSEQEAAAERAKAAQESARLQAEHEAYRLQVQQEQERAAAEAETQKLAQQQSQQWEEARRRSLAQEQAEVERAARQLAEAQIQSSRKYSRGPRKSLPLGKMMAGLFVLALAAVAALPYVLPMDEYIAPIEAEISAQIKQPVHLKKISFSLLPMPRLELHGVAVGKAEELKVGDVIVNFDISALFAATKSIRKLELKHAILSGSALEKIVIWLQLSGASEQYPVSRMVYTGLRIYSDEIKLPAMNGHADFDPQGKFTGAVLKSDDGKLALELQMQLNNLKVDVNVAESSLPVLPNIKFNDMSFSALVNNGEAVISDFFAHIYGGALTGKGRLNWLNGWKLQGQINARNIDLQRMLPGSVLSGEAVAEVNVAMAGNALSQLDKAPVVEGSFEAKNGVISKVDLETVARFGARPGVAGRTNYTEIAGTVKSANHVQKIFVSKLLSPAASTTGVIDIDEKQQLSGRLQIDIKGPGNANFPLKLSGTLADPLLQQGR